MQTSVHPEVLAIDWVPPTLLGRERELAEAVRRLDPPAPRHPAPWILAIAGPAGSGTSALARRAAREVAERVRAARSGPTPRVLAVRTGSLRGAHGVATAFLQRLDDGFDGRGFPVNEILAGFLRRLRRDARPTVLVIDDLRVGSPDLGPLLRALAGPDRFLPEGEFGLPPLWTILAGTSEGVAAAERSAEGRCPLGPYLGLAPYEQRTLAAIVTDRFERAMVSSAPASLVTAAVRRALEDGAGATRAIDLVRRRLVGSSLRSDSGLSRRARLAVPVEPRIVAAIGAAVHGASAPLGEVKRWESSFAGERGERPLPATTFWRRIVALERAGYLRREIRPGGTGGTRSIVRLLAPIDEWVTAPTPWGSPRAAGAWGEASRSREPSAAAPAPTGSSAVIGPVG
jgi:hypothetical protein